MTLLEWLDLTGVALFAATGALAASRKELDILGFVFMASVTGVGGGTIRDLVLDVPVFWIDSPVFLVVSTAAAVLVFFTAHRLESRWRLIQRLDALAIAAYGVFGAHKGLEVTGSPVVAVVMGLATGTFGGILRDVLAREPSALLQKELYVSAVFAGCVVYVGAEGLGLPLPFSAAAGVVTTTFLRIGAIRKGWTLPSYRACPGRDPRDL